MGNSESTPQPSSPSPSSPQCPSLLEGITKLNDSVFELYRPQGKPELEVIFFHGLQLDDYKEAYWKTWLSRSRDVVVWPKAWLGPSLERARILSISYDSAAQTSNNAGVMRMFQIIENLLANIIDGARCGQDCKVILVGHSLGGIIIKRLLLECNNQASELDAGPRKHRLETFLRNCSGVFYYATPHGGSRLADYCFVPGWRLNMKIIEFLKVFNSDTAVINTKFSNFRKTEKLFVKTATIAELLPTKLGPVSRLVVEEGSSRYDVDTNYTAATDHLDVCKPESQGSNIFTNLVDFCRELVPGLESVPELEPELEPERVPEASLEERYAALRETLPN